MEFHVPKDFITSFRIDFSISVAVNSGPYNGYILQAN